MYDYSTLVLDKKQLQNLNKSFGQYQKYYLRMRYVYCYHYNRFDVLPSFISSINHHYKGLIECDN